MQNIIPFLPYIIIFIAILVFVFKLKKFKNLIPKDFSSFSASSVEASYDNKMPALAEMLGLTYEEAQKDTSDKKTFMNSGGEMHGTYRNLKMEIAMGVTAKHIGLSVGSYSYSMKKFIAFEVTNPDSKAFHIQPKNKNVVAKDTGEEIFDKKLMISGNTEIPAEFLNYFGQFEWLNLKLEKHHFIFNDTFYEDLLQSEGTSAMMVARHPIWGSTPQNPAINLEKVKEFIDKLVDLSESLKLD